MEFSSKCFKKHSESTVYISRVYLLIIDTITVIILVVNIQDAIVVVIQVIHIIAENLKTAKNGRACLT